MNFLLVSWVCGDGGAYMPDLKPVKPEKPHFFSNKERTLLVSLALMYIALIFLAFWFALESKGYFNSQAPRLEVGVCAVSLFDEFYEDDDIIEVLRVGKENVQYKYSTFNGKLKFTKSIENFRKFYKEVPCPVKSP